MERLAEALDGMVVSYSEGLLAARPTPAIHGRLYYATDGGGVFYDTGVSWVQLNLNSASITQAKGDLLVGTGPGAIARLPAGGDGQVLQALAGATLGLQWTNILGLPLALTGAGASTRYVGGTVTGAPSSGTFSAGDFAIAQDGALWVCTQGGKPGTWISPTAAAGPSGSPTIPLCDIKLSSPIVLPTSNNIYATSGWTTVTDTGGGMAHPASSDPTRSYVQIKTAGRYLAHLHASITGIDYGQFVSAKLLLNTANADSNSIGADSDGGTSGENNLDVWCERNFSVGDRIYWSFWTDEPGNSGRVQPATYGDSQTKLTVRYVGPAV
jgi:hypothetical protein